MPVVSNLRSEGRARIGAGVVLSAVLLVLAAAGPAGALSEAHTAAATVLYVATPANGGDDAHLCSQTSPCATLQHAADVSVAGSTIHIGAGTFAGLDFSADGDLSIIGAGQGQTRLDGGRVTTVIVLRHNVVTTVADLTVQHGAVGTTGLARGSGIESLGGGELDLARVTVTANTGNGIYNDGFIRMSDSTVSDNTQDGLKNFDGFSTVTGSTFTGNATGVSDESCCGSTYTNDTFSRNDFGFSASNTSTAVVTASTIADNRQVGLDEGGFIVPGLVAGVTVGSTIIANNAAGNCAISVGQSDSGHFDDAGSNLESDAGGSCEFSTANHDLVGSDPLLGSLQDNGGPTRTMLPAATSPVVDGVTAAAGLCPTTDQRGVARPVGSACDIGAVEVTVSPPGVRGNIFAVTFKNCRTLHVGYNRFPDGTVVHWTVTSDGLGHVASGDFTAIGGGKARSKTYHFHTQPLGATLQPSPVHSHVHFTWPGGGMYVATRNPTC